MQVKKSLKKRITRSFLFLAFLLAGFFTIVSYCAVEVIEAQVIDGQLEKLADTFIHNYHKDQLLITPPGIAFFVNDAIPPELKSLPPGLYERTLNENETHILIRKKGVDRFAFIHDMREFEHTEFIIFSVLGIGFVASLTLAILWGLSTSKYIIHPVSALAAAVEKNTFSDTLPSTDAEDEIGILSRAFAKRTNELQRFLQRERVFTGDVSHELRTPLTIMLGAAEVLKAQLTHHPAAFAVAERIRRVALETAERVSALLLLSRAPTLIDNDFVSLIPLIETEIERCKFLLREKPVEWKLELNEDVVVNGRPELIGIMIGNVLRNACQHTERGFIRINLTSTHLIIEDSGSGISEDIRNRLFERFSHGNNKDAEGTGLGLSIVKRISEHIGWEISHENREIGGSRFTISFHLNNSSL